MKIDYPTLRYNGYLLMASPTSLPAMAAGVATVAAAISILVYAFKVFVRPLFPVTVECWFCMRKSRVGYEKKV